MNVVETLIYIYIYRMKGLSTFVSKYESKYEDFKVKHAQRKSSEKVNKTKQSKAGNSVFRKETSRGRLNNNAQQRRNIKHYPIIRTKKIEA